MEFKRQRRSLLAFNLTPLVDMVLTLIIFFMLSSSFVMQPGIQVKLPQAASADPGTRQDVVVILTEQGQLFVQDVQVAPDELLEALRREAQALSSPVLVLRADESVTHGRVVQVMDAAKQAGIQRLAIATAPKPGQ